MHLHCASWPHPNTGRPPGCPIVAVVYLRLNLSLHLRSPGPSTNTGVLLYLRRVQGFYFVLVLASNNRFCTYHNWCNLPFFWLPSLVSAGTCLSQDFRSETYFRNFALYKCVYVTRVVNVEPTRDRTARRIILKLEVHVELHVSGSAPPAAQGTLGRLSVPSTSL